jgi:HEAT repeat protein
MTENSLVMVLLIISFVDALLVASLILLKAIHRRLSEDHDRRRSEYLELLAVGLQARHVTFPDHTASIGQKVAKDTAFLDAVIDLRSIVSGPEVDTLSGIIGRYGIAEIQAAHLRSRFPRGRRFRAAVSLAEMGDESSIAVLMQHLSDREPEVRIQCARGLGRLQWTPGIDAIVDRFNVETPWVRSRFADTLVRFGGKATWPLVAYIRVNHKHETEGPRAAIRTLATIGDDQAGVPLIEILEEATNPEIKIAIVEALGFVGGPLALAPLGRMFDSTDWRIRAKAGTSLGEIGDPSAIPTLVQGLVDENWWVRRNSAAALAHLPKGTAALYAALEASDPFARDAAAEALATAGELIAARRRYRQGEATEQDRRLLNHMMIMDEASA